MRSRKSGWLAVLGALVALVAAPVAADTARTGLDLAAAAADAWADDAQLAWIENDSPIDPHGQAESWGYLYYSPSKHAMRSWALCASKIVAAEDQPIVAAAPAVDPAWKDTDAIAAAAWSALDPQQTGSAALESLVLVRGVFAAETTWVAVFAVGSGPRLFMVLDATDGKLIKRWRG